MSRVSFEGQSLTCRKPAEGWNKRDRHNHTPEQLQWLEEHGAKWVKVCAEPGDLLLWDSVSRVPSTETQHLITAHHKKIAS